MMNKKQKYSRSLFIKGSTEQISGGKECIKSVYIQDEIWLCKVA